MASGVLATSAGGAPRSPGSWTVPLLGPGRRVVLGLVTVAWLLAGGRALHWWFGQAPLDAGGLASSVVLVTFVAVLPGGLFFLLNRARRPNPLLRLPATTRVAMVVTKAPSEPWSMVQTTLEAMLRQELDLPYDVWLADEDPSPATVAWCIEHGVGVSTRRDAGPAYHRDSWPRRKRCKEGNLAFFYDRFGYERYDIVSQLDADHVPAPDYLRRITIPFANPDVGYVSAPSVCDLNAATSWTARGRLHDEAMLHGVMHAGANGGYAPSCIGSHYAVRTAAVHEIGGLGPDLAEDFSTTLLLSAAGWDGAFAIDAEAHGRGPDTVTDCVTQELQWSQSMMTLLLTIGPSSWRQLTVRRKARLGFCLLWYPLIATVFVIAHLMPLWALVQGGPLVSVGILTYLHHIVAVEVLVLLAVLVVRGSGNLRPANAPVISWEMVLYRLVRWPWNALGCLIALYMVLTKRPVEWKVTPKGNAALGRPLDLRVVLFPLLIVAIFAVPLLVVPDADAAGGYALAAILGACVYTLVAAALVGLHRRESPGAGRTGVGPLRLSAGPVALTMIAATVSVVVLRGPASVQSVTAADAASSTTARSGAWAADRRLGVSVGRLSQDEGRPFRESLLDEVGAFAWATGRQPGTVTWFSDWVQPAPSLAKLDGVAAIGAVPQITWEPRDARAPRSQQRFRLARIHRGDFDGYAATWARRLATYGRPVMLRFAHEMNHPAYPWGTATGNRPAQFVAAWRHLHAVFARAGATNVQWVWGPSASNFDWAYYPGDDVVDIIGLTGFNGGTELRWNGWRSPETIFAAALEAIRRNAPDKPVEISEVSTLAEGGNRPAWIEGLFRMAGRYPQLRTISWFNIIKQGDWSIRAHTADAAAFRRGAAAWQVARPRCSTTPIGPALAPPPSEHPSDRPPQADCLPLPSAIAGARSRLAQADADGAAGGVAAGRR
ncbi:MAG: glycosyltransferase family 2 protein [Solirubrobacteraceae bacterium]